MQGVGLDFDGVAGEDACGLGSATKHDGIGGLDVAEAGNEAS